MTHLISLLCTGSGVIKSSEYSHLYLFIFLSQLINEQTYSFPILTTQLDTTPVHLETKERFLLSFCFPFVFYSREPEQNGMMVSCGGWIFNENGILYSKKKILRLFFF